MKLDLILQAAVRAWRERRFASRRCRELLQIHKNLRARHPALGRFDIYKELVAARTGSDADAAEGVLERAAQSYASWPVSRPLNLRDVIHYLAASEFLATQQQAHWIEVNFKRILDASIPWSARSS